jgi:thiamine-monophosphate kinase
MGRVLSDLAAMGAAPRWLLINLVAPESMLLSDIDDIYRGANKIASDFGAVIVGGDVAKGSNLELHVFGTGAVPEDKMVQRKGAASGDLLFVTGALGGSITGGHLKFIPRVTEGIWLRDWVTAMMDISDGLASDLRRLLKMSNAGADLQIKNIPITDAALGMSDSLTALEHALYDGEDFELLFTVANGRKCEFYSAWQKEFNLPCTCIGAVTNDVGKIFLVNNNGGRALLDRHGYEHFGYGGDL